MVKLFKRKYPTGRILWGVTCGTGPDRVRKIIGPTKDDAESYAATLTTRVRRAKLGLAPSAKELEECIKAYLVVVKGRKKPRTFVRYSEYLNHLSSFLKEKFPAVALVGEVQPLHLEEFGTWRLQQKRAAKTVQSELEGISTFFKWCENMGHVTANPVKKVSKPKPYQKKAHIFSASELEKIFRNAGENEVFFRTLYYTGFRLREASEMKAADVDLRHNRILYHNQKANRDEDVEINARYRPYLEKLMKGKGPKDLLFPDVAGEISTKFNNLRINFHKLLDRLHISQGTLHVVKNSVVTHLLDADVPPTVVQYLAHHKDLQTTLGYYRGPPKDKILGAINNLPA